MIDPRVIVALDYPDARSAVALAARLDPELCRLKVGKELYTAAGPSLIEKLRGSGFGIFLDLKFHDIPSTVAGACLAAAELDVWMINVHALGGRSMLEAARAALSRLRTPPKLVALLNEKVRSAMAAPDQMKRFQERGMEVITNSPEEYAAYLKTELQKWGKLIRERNIKAE